MPKRVSKEVKRVPLNCLVLPETLRWLKASGSQGKTVDRAVAALRMQEAQGRAHVVVIPVIQNSRKLSPIFKGPLLKPKDRQK